MWNFVVKNYYVQLTFICVKFGGGTLKSIGGKYIFGGRTAGFAFGYVIAGGIPLYDCK